MYTIYMHENKINHKVYIGQTKRKPEIRWGKNGSGYTRSTLFYNAILKYGWINFEHKILKIVNTAQEANYWEKYFIKYYDSNNEEKGYNILPGGAGAYPKSSGMKNFYKQLSKDEKITLYDNRRGAGHPKSKAVICIETGEEFPCLRAAADWCNLKNGSGNISSQIAGRKKTAGKHPISGIPLHWKFKEESLNPEEYSIQQQKKKGIKVINLETNFIFNSMVEAGNWAGVKNNRICESCKSNGVKAAGKHPEEKYKLHWRYLEK